MDQLTTGITALEGPAELLVAAALVLFLIGFGVRVAKKLAGAGK